MLQDYYAILQVTPQATLNEIKIAYRTLAKQYHPDVAGNDAEKQLHFAKIKLAYDTLISPTLKQQYLERRWLHKSEGKDFAKTAPTTAGSVVAKVIQLEQTTFYMDVTRNNEHLIAFQLEEILTEEHCTLLQAVKDTSINQTICRTILTLLPSLPINYLPIVKYKLLQLTYNNSEAMQLHIERACKKRIQQQKVEKLKWIGIVLLVLCLLGFIALL